MRGMTRGMRRCAVLLFLVGAGVLVVGAQAASAQVIEICKSSANGMSGRPFSYTVAPSGGSSFAVGPIAGGRCSGPITVSGGSATITEAVSDPATDVKSVTVRPSARKTSEDLANRKVTVQTGASTASETLVTFTNQPAGGNYGSLKVCKLTETPAYLGRSFSFSVNGGPIVSTEANDAFDDPANYTCRILGTFQVGSVVNVHEQIPAGSEVQWIDTDPGENLLDFNTASGDATIQIAAGMTIVYYDNEPAPPAGTGWLEVCKNVLWSDPDVWGAFDFTVTDAAGVTHELTVLAGQCSEPIQVAAGVNEIAEHATANTELRDVEAFPWDRLLTVNEINRTATVEVPVSDSSNDETQVHFTNKALRGQLKVCKALGAGSADLIGESFYFSISEGDEAYDGVWITAAASTQCKIVGFFPLGSVVDVQETCGRILPMEQPNGDNHCNEFIDVSGEGEITIAPGVNTKTITNTAKGLLEVCKAKIQWRFDGLKAELRTQPTFTFRIDGGAPFGVQAGKCSPPKRVSVGNHTVTESNGGDYELDPDAPGYGITVFPADREVSKNLPTRTVTVSVPYGPYGETLVTFYNRIKLGRVKVCKDITPGSVDALSKKTFTFNVYIGQPAVDFNTQVKNLAPGECAFASDANGNPVEYPVLQPSGNQTPVGVLENNAVQPPTNAPGTFYVSNLALTGGRPNTQVFTNCVPAGYSPTGKHCAFFTAPVQVDGGNPNVHIEWFLGAGINVVTFTNTAGDP